ncbi:hypothetical protein [Psychrobacter immobilis]|uniref:hypothetical protein n=1 Tax=Psychrobacter immobilis TaxID=498 RepID=UPI00191B3116|nr:hypothetical protein [Psychrobacter immobilis]
MKRSTLSLFLVISLLLELSLFQIGCMQQEKKQDPYKEGDIVTWKIIDKKGKYESEMSDQYNLQCDIRDDVGLGCFGNSTNSQVSGIVFSFWNNEKVKAISYEPIYGGIKVEWYFHRSNLEHWQEIDAAIWRLLDTWNISSIE